MPPGARKEPPQDTTTPAIEVYTLGGFRVLVGGLEVEDQIWRRRTARQLFKVLLTRPGRRMTREEAIELFWPDSDPSAASSNLRSTIHALRRALDATGGRPELVSVDHTSLWLPSHQELWADADAFEQTVAEAWRSQNALPLLDEASRLYGGDYLPDDLYEDWATERRESLRRNWTELQFGLAQALDTETDVRAALEPLERLLRADPCSERAAQELMRLLARHHQRGEALRTYQRLVQALREELDIEPSPETVELHRQINAGQSVAKPLSRPNAFRCSYPFPTPQALIGRASQTTAMSRVLTAGRSGGAVALIAAPAGTGTQERIARGNRQAGAGRWRPVPRWRLLRRTRRNATRTVSRCAAGFLVGSAAGVRPGAVRQRRR